MLSILDDDKPTAVSQALLSIRDIITYKPELNTIINNKLVNLHYLKYNDTMHSIIKKDIEVLLDLINN